MGFGFVNDDFEVESNDSAPCGVAPCELVRAKKLDTSPQISCNESALRLISCHVLDLALYIISVQ